MKNYTLNVVLRLFAFFLVLSFLAFSQSFEKPKISVKLLPSENIPKGSCLSSTGGYLGDKNGDDYMLVNADNLKIGEYVVTRLREGYSVEVYPQASGRIFVIAECHAQDK